MSRWHKLWITREQNGIQETTFVTLTTSATANELKTTSSSTCTTIIEVTSETSEIPAELISSLVTNCEFTTVYTHLRPSQLKQWSCSIYSFCLFCKSWHNYRNKWFFLNYRYNFIIDLRENIINFFFQCIC